MPGQKSWLAKRLCCRFAARVCWRRLLFQLIYEVIFGKLDKAFVDDLARDSLLRVPSSPFPEIRLEHLHIFFSFCFPNSNNIIISLTLAINTITLLTKPTGVSLWQSSHKAMTGIRSRQTSWNAGKGFHAFVPLKYCLHTAV
jgi:hypothetical protein